MIVLDSVSMEKIWGTKRLRDYGGDNQIENVGLVYTASGISEITNPINSKDFEENDFHSAVRNNPEKFGLPTDFSEFPIIISFTAADEDLSIQVHPTDQYAQIKESKKYGKSESWYFITPPEKGWIYAGAKEKNKDIILRDMENGQFEKTIDKLEIKKKDLVFIPSGTLHALTKGSLVYEIQQSTDITYRFYDFDRKDTAGNLRELHINKAIETLEPESKVTKKQITYNNDVIEKPYTLKLSRLLENYKNNNDIAQILTVLQGEYYLNDELLSQGKSVVILPNEHINVLVKEIGDVMIATPNI